MIRWLSILVLLALPFGTVWAQELPNQKLVDTYREKYPDEPGVFLHREKGYTIDINRDGQLEVATYAIEERLFTDEAAVQYAEDYLHYNSYHPLVAQEAYSLVPDGKRMDKRKVKQFKEVDDFADHAFFDDAKKVRFQFSGLTVGAQTYLRHEHSLKEPRFLGSYYLQSYLPAAKSRLVVEAHEDVNLVWAMEGDTSYPITFTKEHKGKTITYTWSVTDIDKLDVAEEGPSVQYYTPHVIIRIASYVHNGQTVPVLRDVSDLHHFYTTLVEGITNNDYEALRPVADSLTAGLTTELDKVKAIYHFVQDKIKYIAISAGEGGFVPRDPELVYQRRYGDCKDMSCLMYGLAKAANIDRFYIAWVGTRDLPYSYTKHPSPIADNHMVSVYDAGDQMYVLDATNSYSPLDMPSWAIQGKELLVHVAVDSFFLHRVPIYPAQVTQYVDSSTLTIKEGKIAGKGTAKATGYMRMDMHYGHSIMDEDRLNRYYQRLLRKGNNTFSADVRKVAGLDDRYRPIELDYDFAIDNYITTIDNEIYVNPHLYKGFIHYDIDTTVNFHAVDELFATKQVFHTLIDIPDGYKVTYVPEEVAYENELFGFSLDYQLDEERKQLAVDLTFKQDYIMLPEEQFGAFNDMINTLRKAYNEVIILEKP